MSPLTAVRGMHDLLGQEYAQQQHLVAVLHSLARKYGFVPIQTPIVEQAAVFQRTLGETSDVVSKEMYTFPDRNEVLLTLRPEGTAGIARAFIEHKWYDKCPLKVSYNGAMFRYERPQKGRQRQFHQAGIEILGLSTPEADVEALVLAWQYLKTLNLTAPFQLEINTLGDAVSRTAYRTALCAYLNSHQGDLSADSQARLSTNPLRILDSKDANDREILQEAPKLADSLTAEASAFFARVQQLLTTLGIPFVHNPHLVRGLDYYSHTAFEITTTALGAQGTLLAGGRYDTLIETMGGKPTAGVGWAAGLERLALLLPETPLPAPLVAVIPMAAEQQDSAFCLAQQLRVQGLAVSYAHSGNAAKRLKRASEEGCMFAALIGSEEQVQGTITLKNLSSGYQEVVPQANIYTHLTHHG